MERLTKPLCGGYELPMIPMEIKTQDDLQKFHEARKFYESCAIRCGQYEDTGLEPEEIKNALDVNDIIPEINVTVDHLRDILQAEQDGRIVVLPCKVGTPVHGKYGNWSGEVMEFSINSDGVQLYVRSGGGGFYCKPEDIEVEAALKGGDG